MYVCVVVLVSLSSQTSVKLQMHLGTMTFAVNLGDNGWTKKISKVNEEKVGKTRSGP